jgi:hypothetical protein
MKLRANWHSTWTFWQEYRDRETGMLYKSRRRQLFCGKMLMATLVQSTSKKYKYPFYMYSQSIQAGSHNGCTVRGPTAFRTVRRFIREKLQ